MFLGVMTLAGAMTSSVILPPIRFHPFHVYSSISNGRAHELLEARHLLKRDEDGMDASSIKCSRKSLAQDLMDDAMIKSSREIISPVSLSILASDSFSIARPIMLYASLVESLTLNCVRLFRFQ